MLIATAGHIDHGKTSLVRALTGVETDRLPEEKARGMSIDLGFAYWQTEPGVTLGFVDVPGHERFVRNMLAGASMVDFALLVVAADDGIMPQTAEHLELLDLLQINRGIVAITKIDRVSSERCAEVEGQVRALVSGTSLTSARVHRVSAVSGEGIEELAALLRHAAVDHRTHTRPTSRQFRFAIDRAFSVTGAGSVVTGTIIDGQVTVGDRLVLSPEGKELRVRALQSAGIAVDRLAAGERCAINIAGVELASLHRGDWLCALGMGRATSRISARIAVLKGQGKALRHNTPLHVHIGTADVVARVLLSGQREIAPGSDARVQLVLDAPICCCTGDRLVIRDASGRRTLGGGHVIDPFANGRGALFHAEEIAKAYEAGSASNSVEALLSISGYEIDVAHFAQSFNLSEADSSALCEVAGAELLRAGTLLAIPRARLDDARRQIVSQVTAFHREQPDASGVSIRVLQQRVAISLSSAAFMALIRDLSGTRDLEFAGSLVKIPGHVASFSTADSALWNGALLWLEDRGMAPFTVAELVAELRISEAAVKAMVYRRLQAGDVWQITEKRLMLPDQVARLAACAARLDKAMGGKGFAAAQFRDAVGTGRTMAVQILEFLDGIGVTVRRGDLRKVRSEYAEIVGEVAPCDP